MKAGQLRLGLVGPVPPPNGGMAMQTLQLLNLLQREGVKVSMVASNGPYTPAFVGSIPVLRALFRLVPYLFRIWRLAGKVQVIHLMANSGWSWQLYAAPVLWLAWLRSVPVIVNYRGGEASTYFQQSFSRVRPSLEKAAMVTVPSGYLQAVFAEYGQVTRVIPNIVDLDVFNPYGAASNKRHYTLVITRNLESIYGIEVAIRALAEVHCNHPEVQLRIAGSGPQEQKLKKLARELGLDDVVHFEGRLDRAGIVELYASADAMINPTTVDNMPNSIIEAMACGIPVISTDVGGVPYVVTDEESALLVSPNDSPGLAAAILRLMSDSTLSERLRKSALKEVEQYAWPQVRDKWLQAYDSVLGFRQGVRT